jgi:hypothetical protein
MTIATLESPTLLECKSRADADSPWKLAFDLYFADFMNCCFPEIAKEIDWNKGYEFMDKEMQTITHNARIGRRTTDKLIKLWKKDQQEIFFLCHLEVQGYDKNLPERMLVYRYRTRDRYNKPIISIAILIDNKPNWRPHSFWETYYDTYLEVHFLIVKVLDYRQRGEELVAMNNRFAIVLLAQLVMLETKNDPQARLKAKIALSLNLYEKGWGEKDITQLYSLVDWLITLPEELEVDYNNTIKHFEEEKMRNIGYVTTAERIGRREGLQEGLQQGLQLGEATILILLLEHRFQKIPEELRVQIKQADPNTLLRWAERVLDATSLAEVFRDSTPEP